MLVGMALLVMAVWSKPERRRKRGRGREGVNECGGGLSYVER